jgi:hypothetical protein
MKKINFSTLVIFFLIAACSGKKIAANTDPLSYSRLFDLKISQSEDDVMKLLGTPQKREEQSSYFTLIYQDSNKNQRMRLNFSSSDRRLISFLWIPLYDEKEALLKNAQAGFTNAQFKEVKKENPIPHIVDPTFFYIDDKLGVTIRYNPQTARVEGISRYDSLSERVPADSSSQKSSQP